MKFFIYMFYRFQYFYKYKNPTDGWIHAFILIGALFLIHLLTIIQFIETLTKNDFMRKIRIDNGLMDRFVLFPILIFPVYLILFFYYRKNKLHLREKIKEFKSETVSERKRKGRFILFYLTISIFLFFLSIISPIFVK